MFAKDGVDAAAAGAAAEAPRRSDPELPLARDAALSASSVPIGTLALETPFLAARTLVDRFDITLSGAGKLLSRAAEKGLLVETSGRKSWRLYVTPDVGIALGIVAPPRGRPPSPSRSSPALDTVLAKFDIEMAEIDRLLSDHSRKHTEA